VQVVEKEGESIDLVILDTVMPHMDGRQVFDAIKSIVPDMPVVVCSGYSEGGQVEYIIRNGGCAFLRKPCDMDHILRTINSVLENQVPTQL